MKAISVALAAFLSLAACDSPVETVDPGLSAEDAAIVAAVSAQIGALGEYVAPAMAQIGAREGDAAAHARCAELERLRLQLQDRLQNADQPGTEQARLRLRLSAAEMIHAGLADGPLAGMLTDNDALLERYRARIQEHARLRRDTTANHQQYQSLLRLQSQARVAHQNGQPVEALELAAQVREQLRAQDG